jgi:histidine triad (HIT) family protein
VTVCPFCERIEAGAYQQPFTPDPDVVWFRPLNPVTPGHMLFVPVRHVESALDDPYTTGLVMEIASRWTRSRRFRADGWNFITSAGEAATQTVSHMHAHVVPRRAGDGLALPWTGQQRAESGLAPANEAAPVSTESDEPRVVIGDLSMSGAYMAGAAAERERIRELADRNGAVCTGDEGTSCYFSALIREGTDG